MASSDLYPNFFLRFTQLFLRFTLRLLSLFGCYCCANSGRGGCSWGTVQHLKAAANSHSITTCSTTQFSPVSIRQCARSSPDTVAAVVVVARRLFRMPVPSQQQQRIKTFSHTQNHRETNRWTVNSRLQHNYFTPKGKQRGKFIPLETLDIPSSFWSLSSWRTFDRHWMKQSVTDCRTSINTAQTLHHSIQCWVTKRTNHRQDRNRETDREREKDSMSN